MNTTAAPIKPIRRHKVLQPLSREHHHVLLLVWKIRKGLRSGIDPERIRKYTGWFYENYIVNHFELEEKYIYPVLPPSDENIVRALDEHNRLKKLFEFRGDLPQTLALLAYLLDSHIRFEERVLFNIIQQKATDRQLQDMERMSKAGFVENETDCFWL